MLRLFRSDQHGPANSPASRQTGYSATSPTSVTSVSPSEGSTQCPKHIRTRHARRHITAAAAEHVLLLRQPGQAPFRQLSSNQAPVAAAGPTWRYKFACTKPACCMHRTKQPAPTARHLSNGGCKGDRGAEWDRPRLPEAFRTDASLRPQTQQQAPRIASNKSQMHKLHTLLPYSTAWWGRK